MCMAFAYLLRLIPRLELESIFHNSIIRIILNRIAAPRTRYRDDLTKQVLKSYTEPCFAVESPHRRLWIKTKSVLDCT